MKGMIKEAQCKIEIDVNLKGPMAQEELQSVIQKVKYTVVKY